MNTKQVSTYRRFWCCALAILGLAFEGAAHAQLRTAPPDSGYYWETGRGGRGWALESQDDLVFITHYVYDTDGFSTFFVTQGRWDPIGRRIVDNELYQTDNGPCIGCPYVGADVFQIGTADWVFSDRDSAVIRYSNGANITVPIARRIRSQAILDRRP
jgi:hypothetical protein